MTVDLRPTRAVVLNTDDSIEHIYLKGRDAEKLQQVVDALDTSAFARVPIRGDHGVIAHAWIDKSGRTKELPPNRIGSELMGYDLVGPIVVIGPSDETVAFDS